MLFSNKIMYMNKCALDPFFHWKVPVALFPSERELSCSDARVATWVCKSDARASTKHQNEDTDRRAKKTNPYKGWPPLQRLFSQ